VFPVLFPVCSQTPVNTFNVFPMFSVPEAGAISAFFCIPFLQPGNTGNNGNSIAIQGPACRARWNSRGTTGNRYEGSCASGRHGMCTADFRMPVIGNDGSNSLQVMDATELGPPENRRVEPRQ
jgi:hypothetical protein